MFWSRLKSKLSWYNNQPKGELNLSDNTKQNLEKLLGYKIEDDEYYIKALTHRSFLESATADLKSNERLEFLGDSVLGQITAEYLFKKFPDEDEGFLTKTRSHLVNTESLIEVSKRIRLPELIFIEEKFKARAGDGINKISADSMEALIGAIYLDRGLKEAGEFVHKYILVPNFRSGSYQVDRNFKGQLLELTHMKKLKMPVYKVVDEEGPEHDKIFSVEVLIDKVCYGAGQGKNKKSAEQAAAEDAIKKLNKS